MSFFLAGAFGGTARGELRTWTDRTGQQIEAEAYRSNADVVWLRCQGKLIMIRLAQLSEADQQYLRDTRAGAKSPASAFGAAASAEGTTDDTAQSPEATPSLPQKSPAQGSGQTPAPTEIAHGELRTWTARNGEYTVVAEYVSGDELSVKLGRDGKQRTIPLAALCDADQQFVRDLLSAAKPADTVSTAAVTGESKGADEVSDSTSDWLNLIDSSSFDKWTTVGAPGVFKLLPDATVRGAGARAYLVSPKMYSDFELTGRMKVSGRGNGGVFFGVPRGMNLDNPRGYEVQLYVRTPGNNNGTGSIWRDGQLTVPLAGRFEVPDRWYPFSIRCQGPSILVKIDDQTVFEHADGKRSGGHLALQCYEAEGEVHYADLRIRQLAPSQAASLAAAASAGKQAAAPEPLAILGIRPGMTVQEIVPIIRSRGFTVSEPHKTSSALSNLPGMYNRADKYIFVHVLSAKRQDGPVETHLEVILREDLPERPGVGVCSRVSFVKKNRRVRNYQGEFVANQLPAWFEQVREELIRRYGQPDEERDNSISFGDDDSEKLAAEVSSEYLSIRLTSQNIERRSKQGAEILREKPRPQAPKLKIDKIDF